MYRNQFIRTYDNNSFNNQRQPQISLQDSIQIATNHISGQVIKVELEMEDGLLVYEVKIMTPEGYPYEIEVDAITGEIVKVELD